MNGVDYDLEACLEYNPQEGYTVEDIQRVYAVWEGKHDYEDSWRWVLGLKDGRFLFLEGACDYTGWDCRSYGISTFTDGPVLAAHVESENDAVLADLLRQIEQGKDMTWRQQMDVKMGINSLDPSAYANPDLDGAI